MEQRAMADVENKRPKKRRRENGLNDQRNLKSNSAPKKSKREIPEASGWKQNVASFVSSDGESNDTDAEDTLLTRHRHGGDVHHASGHAKKQSTAEHIEQASRKETSQSVQDQDEWRRLIKPSSLAKNKFPEGYNQTLDVKGACPLFHTPVSCLRHQSSSETPDGPRLPEPSSHSKLHAVLRHYASGKPFCSWASKRLAAALNLKITSPALDSLQLLFLAENKPAQVCVLCDEQEGSKESALACASEIARELTRSLLAHCHCEFIILPVACVASKDTLTAEKLHEEVEERRQETSKIYYRRQHLSKGEYHQLARAVTRVSRIAPVHQHHADINNTTLSKKKTSAEDKPLVMLDEDWFNLVLYFISRADDKGFTLSLPEAPNAVLKVKVAVREAERRLGVKMTLTETKDGCLRICVEE